MTGPPTSAAVDQGFAVFDTAIGACAIVWSTAVVVGFSLPDTASAGSEDRLRAWRDRRFPGAIEAEPVGRIGGVTQRVRAMLDGAPDDFRDVALDLSACPEFARRVYGVARTIAPGQTLTYGEVTARLGEPPEAARAVGQALGRNPIPLIVPCHRVTAASGRTGGFSAPGGVRTKLKLLEIEARHAVGVLPLFG